MKLFDDFLKELNQINDDINATILMPLRGAEIQDCEIKIKSLIKRIKLLRAMEGSILESLDELFFQEEGHEQLNLWIDLLNSTFVNVCQKFQDESLTPEIVNDANIFLQAYSQINKKSEDETLVQRITIQEVGIFYAYFLFNLKNKITDREDIFNRTVKYLISHKFPVVNSIDKYFEKNTPFNKIKSHYILATQFSKENDDKLILLIYESFKVRQLKHDGPFIKTLKEERDKHAAKIEDLDQRKCFYDKYNRVAIGSVSQYCTLSYGRLRQFSKIKPRLQEVWGLIKTFALWFKEFLKWDFIKVHGLFYGVYLTHPELMGGEDEMLFRLDTALQNLKRPKAFPEEIDREYLRAEYYAKIKIEKERDKFRDKYYYSSTDQDFKENVGIKKTSISNSEYLKYLREEKIRYTNLLEYYLANNFNKEYVETKNIITYISNEMASSFEIIDIPSTKKEDIKSDGKITNPVNKLDLASIFNEKNNSFDVCKELMEELNLTINFEPNPQPKVGRMGNLTGLIRAIKFNSGMLKIDKPTDMELLLYFNSYLNTKYCSFSINSKDFAESLAISKEYIKRYLNK